jgi:hypothetical protein
MKHVFTAFSLNFPSTIGVTGLATTVATSATDNFELKVTPETPPHSSNQIYVDSNVDLIDKKGCQLDLNGMIDRKWP